MRQTLHPLSGDLDPQCARHRNDGSGDGAVIVFHDLTTDHEKTVASFAGNLPPVGLSKLSISPDEKTIYVVRADPVSSDIKSTHLN